jgi:predicted SprT family Zn-dependent metalloprotease
MKATFCFALIFTIFGCVRYAVAREAVRDLNLHSMYADINRESFQGSLPDARVSWADLSNDLGRTYAYTDGTFEIQIDPTNKTLEQVRSVLSHEQCHVLTIPDLNGQDAHGEKFQRCMLRFPVASLKPLAFRQS